MIALCCGMPRSGSTLQFNIVSRVLEAAKLGTTPDWKPAAHWDRTVDELTQMATSDQIHVIKAHSISDAFRQFTDTPGQIKFVYVSRDIRDVTVSMQVKFGYSIKKAIRKISESMEVQDWLRGLPPETVMFQDYNLLLTDLATGIRQVNDFFGANLDPETLDRIGQQLNLDNAFDASRKRKVMFETLRRKKNFFFGKKFEFADQDLRLHPKHVSDHKGQIGIWKDKLSPSDLQALETAFADRVNFGADD